MANEGIGVPSQGQVDSTATIRYHLYTNAGSYAGRSVGQVRQELAAMWGIPNDAAAYKGKEKMEDSYIIEPGDQLEFHRRMGEKG